MPPVCKLTTSAQLKLAVFFVFKSQKNNSKNNRKAIFFFFFCPFSAYNQQKMLLDIPKNYQIHLGSLNFMKIDIFDIKVVLIFIVYNNNNNEYYILQIKMREQEKIETQIYVIPQRAYVYKTIQ